MIIQNIFIDGFGCFHNFSLKNLTPGINVIKGKNEAGKSTLLSFIRFTFFGYPRSIDKRMTPLNGGKHGGRINCLFKNGEEILIQRFAGSKGGNIEIRQNDIIYNSQSKWFQLLGNASEDLYKNIYAFSLNELTDLNSLSDSKMEDRIFSSGLGLGKLSLVEVENNLMRKSDEIYKHGGSIQLFPRILNKISEKENQIHELQQSLPEYNDLSSKIKIAEQEVESLKSKVEEIEKEKSNLENYLKCYGSFVIIKDADNELKKLPELAEYPEDGLSQLEGLEDKIQEYSQSIDYDTQQQDKLSKKINEITYNNELLDHKDAVDYLKNNQSKYEQTIKEIKQTQQRILQINNNVKNYLKDLGTQWSKGKVDAINDVIAIKDKIKNFKKKLDDLKNKAQLAENVFNNSKSKFEEIIEQKKSEEGIFAKIPEPQKKNLSFLDEQKEKLNRLESIFNSVQAAKDYKPVSNAKNNKLLLKSISIVLLILSVPAFVYDFLIAGICLICSALALFFIAFKFIKSSDLDENHSIRDKFEDLENLKADMNINKKLDTSLIIQLKAENENNITNLKEWNEKKKSLTDLKRKYDLAKLENDRNQKILDAVIKEQNEISDDYKNYLHHLDFSESLTPEAALETLRIIDEIKGKIYERKDFEKPQDEREKFKNNFEKKVDDLSIYVPETIKNQNVVIKLNKIINAKEEAKNSEDEKKELKRQQNALKDKIKSNKIALEKKKNDLKKLLSSISASDKDEFKKKYSDNKNVIKLNENRKNALRTIQTVAGYNKVNEVIDFLETSNKDEIIRDLSSKSSELQDNTKLYEDKKEKLIGFKKELEMLEGPSDLTLRLTELNSLKQKLNNYYKDWLANKIALNILETSKSKYEKERQPAVIKSSSKYFNEITEERYSKIYSSISEKLVTVYDNRENPKTINQLSRGTKEQLLISLRLGLIKEYEKNSEPLPVVMDDIMVNFDPDRAKKTIEVFYEFASNRQLLLFTCHPETVEYFNKHKVNIIDI